MKGQKIKNIVKLWIYMTVWIYVENIPMYKGSKQKRMCQMERKFILSTNIAMWNND